MQPIIWCAIKSFGTSYINISVVFEQLRNVTSKNILVHFTVNRLKVLNMQLHTQRLVLSFIITQLREFSHLHYLSITDNL
jgi:hypothetical protein